MKGVAECLKLTNLFYFISSRASQEPGSTLGEKGEKITWAKKKRIDKRSQLRGSLGRRKGGVHRLAHFNRLYFFYLTLFFPFFPHCGAWSQANLTIIAFSGKHANLGPSTHTKYLLYCNIEQGCQLQVRATAGRPKPLLVIPWKSHWHTAIFQVNIIDYEYLLGAFLDVSAFLSSMSTTKEKNL